MVSTPVSPCYASPVYSPNLYTNQLVDATQHPPVATGHVTNIVATVDGQLPYNIGCLTVRPGTVVTVWMGNICYHVTNIPQWRLVDGGDHPPVVTGVWCIDCPYQVGRFLVYVETHPAVIHVKGWYLGGRSKCNYAKDRSWNSEHVIT